MDVDDAVVEDEVDDANGQTIKKPPPPVLTLVPSVKCQLPEFRDKCRQFYRHKLSACCNQVTRLCGHTMGWQFEIKFNALEHKKLLPVDLFSLELLRDWDAWHTKCKKAAKECADRANKKKRIETLQRVMPPYFHAYLWRWRHTKQCRRVVQEIEWKRCNYEREAYFKPSVLVNATQLSFWQTHTRSRHTKKKKSVVVAIGLSKTKQLQQLKDDNSPFPSTH
ncbi:hypothetical protein FI667_g14450, partial [Globisporangium splendens]